MTSSEISIEFIVQETNLQQSPPDSPRNKLTEALYRNNSFRALSFLVANQADSAKQIMDLQTVLKSEYLLLQYEQKRRINRIKTIQYAYTQAFKRFLWSRPKIQAKTQIIANQKDLLNIHENLVQQIQILKQKILGLKNIGEIVDLKSTPHYSFMRDFNNFYPNWYENISNIISCEVDRCQNIDQVFDCQYSFATKMISSISQNWQVQQYCGKILQPIMEKISNLKDELTIDFGIAYQEHEALISKKAYLKNFMENGGIITPQIKQQIGKLIGQDMSIYLETWLQQMEKLTQNKSRFLLLLEEIGEQQSDLNNLKPRLCFLVYKKIVKNRKILQDIICLLINQIVENSKFPKQIKFVMEQWYAACTKKFSAVKTEDIKSFFGKMIFFNIFFTQFLSMIEENKEISKSIKSRSMETIALIAQKMMFGQQFLQKNKYGYFENIILYYNKTIQKFILDLIIKSRKTIIPKKKIVDVYLISLQSMKFLYEMLQKNQKQPFKLRKFQEKIKCHCDHQIGSERYKASNIYLAVIDRPRDNYTLVFKPKDKRKRALIEFLILIERISQPTSFTAILQQYKNQQHQSSAVANKAQTTSMLGIRSQHQKPSLQIYANYLQNLLKQSCTQIIQQILDSIQQTQKRAKQIKLNLEKQNNFAQNLKKYFQEVHQLNRKKKSYESTKALIKTYMVQKCGIIYQIIDSKVCQVSPGQAPEKTLSACLQDIALYWRNNYQGYDALYQHIIERIKQNIENSGIVDENMLEAVHNIIGMKLYQILKLNEYQTQADKQIQDQKKKHEFVTIEIMQLPNLVQQEELILAETKTIFKKMQKPNSPENLMRFFHDITLVFQNIVLIKGKASDVNADLQIPLMIFVILHCDIRNLQSIMNFTQKFVDEDHKNTVYGQSLTLVKSALILIHSMDAQKLNLPKEKYIKLLEIQEEKRNKMKKQTSRASDFQSSPQKSSSQFEIGDIIQFTSSNSIKYTEMKVQTSEKNGNYEKIKQQKNQ